MAGCNAWWCDTCCQWQCKIVHIWRNKSVRLCDWFLPKEWGETIVWGCVLREWRWQNTRWRLQSEPGKKPDESSFSVCLMKMRNAFSCKWEIPTKKVLRLRHHFFLGAAFFATGFLTSGFFAAVFFAAAMWFPPPTGIGYIFFKFIN